MRSSSRLIGLIATFVAPALLSAQTYPTAADPRTNLKPGRMDAGVAASNMRLVSFSPKPAQFDTVRGLTFINSDVAFGNGHYAYQGNFAGLTIWDVANPAKPVVMSVVECITSQGDPTVYGNLLFMSAEGAGNRNDCGKGGVQDPKDHMAGVRIWDVSNPRAPKLIKNVQTCKGSHTHTIIPSPTNPKIVYIYVSGQQAARPETELAGCNNGTDPADVKNSLFQLDIIKVPLDHPEQAVVIPGARIFTGLDSTPECKTLCAPANTRRPPRGGRDGRGGDSASAVPIPARTGPRNCHDVTAYPAMHLLAAACSSHSIMVDISNPEKPVRRSALTDTNNFQGRHTAGFSNDGKKIIMTDEWGGGTGPMCQAGSIMELGGNTIISLSADARKQTQRAYFKLPAAQSAQENCVSHNGGLIPVPGRDLYVQGWYQGGVDIMDFTDANHPIEIGFFDRGSIDPPPPADSAKGIELPVAGGRAAPGGAAGRIRGTIGGSWGAYYWNGMIYSSELDRGFDIYELTPSAHLSANEIAAAKLVQLKEYNPQSQPKFTWPAAFPVVRSYLDQLVRNDGLANERTVAIANALNAAEKQTGAARGASLTKLAAQVDGNVKGAKDPARVRSLASEIRRLAAVSK